MKWIDRVTQVEHEIVAKSGLIDGAYYEGTCRNASIARWDASRNKFVYTRYKFGLSFEDEIEHPEDEIDRYDVFIPFAKLNDRQPDPSD